MMVWKAPVHLAEERVGRQAELVHACEAKGSARAVARVEHELQVGSGQANSAGDHVHVLVLDLDTLHLARHRGAGEAFLLDDGSQCLDVGAQEARLSSRHLEAVLSTWLL